MFAPLTSVVIATRNRSALLERTLVALARQTWPADRLEIVVADNGSADATRQVVTDFKDRESALSVTYVFVTTPGKSAAVNAGFNLARGAVVALTDDDVEPSEEWIERLVGALDETNSDFAAGRILPAWETDPPGWLRPSLYGVLAVNDNGSERKRLALGVNTGVMAIGANMAVRADVLRRLGGLRTDLGKLEGTLRTGEDHELFLRLIHAGSRGVYEPRAVVRHFVPAKRLNRNYVLEWLSQNGYDVARLEASYPTADRRLLAVPRHMWRSAASKLVAYLRATVTRDTAAQFESLAQMVWFRGYLRHAWFGRRSSAESRAVPRPASILFAHFGQDWITGSERCLLDLVHHLDRTRYRPVVMCNTPGLAQAARDAGARVYDDSAFQAPDQLMPPRRLVAAARRIIRTEQIRLIHATAFEPVKWMLPAARLARIPLLLHVHLPSSEEERCYSWVHQSACIVGTSASAVQGFREDGLRSDRITVIYNAVDPQRLEAGDATHLRQTLGIGDDETVIAIVGSLIERKNQAAVLEAAALLRAKGYQDFRLMLLGDGPDEARLRALANTLGIDDAVAFLGRREDAAAILREVADIAVTAAHQEVFPLNVLEAGFVGLPIVASDIPPHREGIEDGVTGLVVPVHDASAYAVALGRLLDDRQLRSTLGSAARERVRSRFLIDEHIRRFSDLYDRLLSASSFRYGWIAGTTWPTVYTRWFARFVSARVPRRNPGNVSPPTDTRQSSDPSARHDHRQTMTRSLLLFAGSCAAAMAIGAGVASSLQLSDPECAVIAEAPGSLDLRDSEASAHLNNDIRSVLAASAEFSASVARRGAESDSIDAVEGARTAPSRARRWCEAVLTERLARLHHVPLDVVRSYLTSSRDQAVERER